MSGCEFSEDEVRRRSYLIWEREGRRRGCDKEYWKRAKAEIQAECQAALEGRTTRFVLPHITISVRPVRTGQPVAFNATGGTGRVADVPRDYGRMLEREHDKAA
jgi:hypothetical protein